MPRDGVPAGNTTPAAAQAAAQSPDSATAGAPQVLDSLKRIGFSIKIHLLILRAVDSYVNSILIGILRSSHREEMRAIEKKMKLHEDVLIPPVLGVLEDQAQVTDSVGLEAQCITCIGREVEVQEFAIVSFLDTDPDPDPVHHIELEIHLEVVQNAFDQLALRGCQGDQ
uniref:Zinc finger protein 638 n=1 Tax=Homo sapiens TaxID=9606 RepID=A0A096LPI0_HUMAN